MTVSRIAVTVVLALGALALLSTALSIVLALRAEDGRFPLAQVPLAFLVAVAMVRAVALLRRERHAA